MNGLPGIEVLFRKNRRLANKLTQDELKALRQYIEELLAFEHGEMEFQLTALQSTYNAEIRKSSGIIESLQREIKDKDILLKHFSKSDENLANVHKKRGERLEQMQSVLVNDIEMAKIQCRNLFQQLSEVKADLRKKTHLLEEQTVRLEEFEQLNKEVDGANKVLSENKLLSNENLKLKLELDKKNTLCSSLQEHLHTLEKETNQLIKDKQNCDKQVTEMKKDLMSLSQEMADKCEQMSMTKYELEQKSREFTDIARELESLKNNFRVQNASQPTDFRPPQKKTSDQSLKNALFQENKGTTKNATQMTNLHKQYEYLLFRTNILEENIEKYKSDCENLVFLIDQSSTDEYILMEATSRLTTNGNIALEQLLRTLLLRIRSRRSHCSSSLSDLLRRLPSNVEVVAASLKRDVLDIKQKCGQKQMPDLCNNVKRLIPRIDACMNAKYTSSSSLDNMSFTRPSRQLRDKQCADHKNGRVKPQLSILTKTTDHDEHDNRSLHLAKRRSSVTNKLCQLSPTPINLSMTCISSSPKLPQRANTKSFEFEFRLPRHNNRKQIVAWKSDTNISVK